MWRVWRKRGGKADACAGRFFKLGSAARSNQFLEKKYKEIPAEALEAVTFPAPLIGDPLAPFCLLSVMKGDPGDVESLEKARRQGRRLCRRF
ncbi:hypothetical protein ABS71_17090 [bacterium SCN 62-11]|nr:MAG: hypothetical protein ABS71_17090 [bacterium SCN 62-11]